MKKNNLLYRSLFSLAFGLISVAASGQRFEKLIETRTISNHEIVGAEYESTSKSIFILANVSNSNGDGLLIKVNSRTGDTLWSKYVTSSPQNESFQGLHLSNGSLFAFGSKTSQNSHFGYLVKLDLDGDTIWTKHFKSISSTYCGSGSSIRFYDLDIDASGNLYLVGENLWCSRAILLILNSQGVVSSLREYQQYSGNSVEIRALNKIKIVGTNIFAAGRYSIWNPSQNDYKGVWKLSITGDTLDHYNSSLVSNSELFDFKMDATGNFYIAGRHNPYNNQVGILEKLTPSGVSSWTFSPSGSTIQWSGITGIEIDGNGDILISGYHQKNNQSVDQFAAKVQGSSGTSVWQKQYGYGDNGYGRKLLNIFELVINANESDVVEIKNEKVMQLVQKNTVLYDKTGEQHYDIVSAFIKSIRGSDPNGAVYWLARMIEGGEDVKFIARRLLILASEDIGNAQITRAWYDTLNLPFDVYFKYSSDKIEPIELKPQTYKAKILNQDREALKDVKLVYFFRLFITYHWKKGEDKYIIEFQACYLNKEWHMMEPFQEFYE